MRKIYALLFVTILAFGCSTDFDMYADYEDITIVYGLADISSDTTWIKITKAFTGPGNAILIAQNPDSSNYPYKLNAVLQGVKNGVDLNPIKLDTIMIHNKDLTEIIVDENGDTTYLNPFYSPDQLMYIAVGTLDQDAKYTLEITKGEEVITASTPIVQDFHITRPMNSISFSTDVDSKIEWVSATNGKRYEINLVFSYKEYVPKEYTDTLVKSVGWSLGYVESKTTDGAESMLKYFSGANFYNLLESELEDIPNVQRWAIGVDVILACGSQELSTYLDINSGSASLLEEVPVYTNVDGGTGIFASRHTIEKFVKLATVTERNLVNNYDLGFKLSK